MYYLITKWFGVFLFKDREIIKKKLFKKNTKEISDRLLKLKNNCILKDEKEISKNHNIIVNEKRLSKIGIYNPDDIFFKKIIIKPDDYGFDLNILHKALIKTIKISVNKYLCKEDLQIIQMVNAFDDLIFILNLLSERLNSWSILPSYEKKIKPIRNIQTIVKKEIKELEMQIKEDMEKIAPNTSDLVGPLLCARLISKAGGIEQLAKFPSSTIQILGAEKALFRYKKEGGKPPKHGIIYQYPIIKKAARGEKGKISRLIAGKISIAIKADLYTKRIISDKLNEEIERKLKEIRNF
jgi:nucleolar protein 56